MIRRFTRLGATLVCLAVAGAVLSGCTRCDIWTFGGGSKSCRSDAPVR